MPLIDLNELRATIGEKNLSEVARATDLPYFRIMRFVRNMTDKPSYELVVKLAAYVENQQPKK